MNSILQISLRNNYHNFADQRNFFNIPNFFNIISNLFIYIPIHYIIQNRENTNKFNMIDILIINILCIIITSIYYHINPNDNTIIFDKISIVSTIITVCIIILKIENNIIRIILYIIGILSVIYWIKKDNLLFYIILIIGVPIYICYKLYKYTNLRIYIYSHIFSLILLRLVEYYDLPIYQFTNQIISGHSLKHIIASINILSGVIMIHKLNLLD